MKFALRTPLVATVMLFVKSAVPYGLITWRRTTVPVGGVGVIVAVIVPVWVLVYVAALVETFIV